MAKHFKPAFRLEVAELVVDKNYSIREAAEAMGVGVGNPPLINGYGSFAKSATEKKHKAPRYQNTGAKSQPWRVLS